LWGKKTDHKAVDCYPPARGMAALLPISPDFSKISGLAYKEQANQNLAFLGKKWD